MRARFDLLVLIVACMTAMPARADAALTPCGLAAADRLTEMHAMVTHLHTQVLDAEDVALRLHHTSRRYGYKKVEDAGISVRRRGYRALNDLSDMVILLDEAPEDAKKKATLDLISAYWNSVEFLVDYANAVVLFERAENVVSFNPSPQWLTFGIYKGNPQTAINSGNREQLEQRFNEPREVMRSIVLPERSYSLVCGRFPVRQAGRALGPTSIQHRLYRPRSDVPEI